MQPLYYDIIIVLILLFSAWRGHRRGFILTLCGFLAVFVALFGASFLSNSLAEPLSRLVQPIVEQRLELLFDPPAQEVMVPYSQPTGPSLPDILIEEEVTVEEPSTLSITLEEALECLKSSEFYRAFSSAIQSAVDSGALDVTANVAAAIAAYIAKELTQTILFGLFFVLILICWFFLSHALDLAFRLPVLSTLNHWSGFLLGLGRGFLLVFIGCWLLKGRFLAPDMVAQTYLLNWFCTFDPLLYFSTLQFTTSSQL